MPYSVPRGHQYCFAQVVANELGKCWRQFPNCASLVCAEGFKLSREDAFLPVRKLE